jgi:hypothetical protein
MSFALGLVCIALLWIGSIIAHLALIPAVILFPIFKNNARMRGVFRLIDHMTNVMFFGGDWWESVSSHAGRESQTQNQPGWAVNLSKALDVVQQDHCVEAEKRESDVVQFMRGRA